MTISTSPARPRFWRLQFSLRLALLAFTAFAIGFPLWYRWPYEETEKMAAGAPAKLVRKTTWQRQWGGSRLKHGLEQLILNDEEVIESTMYVRGRKHGPYFGQDVRGQYVDDRKEGVWTADAGDSKRTMTWRRGLLDGPGEIETQIFRVLPPPPEGGRMVPELVGQRQTQLIFAAGRLTHLNGKPATNRLFDWIEAGEMSIQIRNELCRTTEMSFVETPLKDVLMYFMDRHAIPIQLDPKVPQPDVPITDEQQGLDLCSALTLVTAPLGLACDYRYGCIWVTTAADADDWHDPTGVSEIRPPKGGALALAWDQTITISVVATRLSDLLESLSRDAGVEIELAPPIGGGQTATATPLVTMDQKAASFRDVLGSVLYRAGYRCKQQGDKLIILPPADVPAAPSKVDR